MKVFPVKTNSSIYIKLLLSFIIVIMPVYAIGLAINISSSNYAKEDILKYMSAQVQYFSETFENEMQKTMGLQREFSNDPDLLRLSEFSAYDSLYDNLKRMDKVRSELSVIKNSSGFIEDVEVSIPLTGKTISVNNQIEDMDVNAYKRLKQAFAISYLRILNIGDMLYMNMYYPYIAADEDPLYAFSVKLSKTKIEDELERFLSYKDSYAFIFSADYSWNISNNKVNEKLTESLAKYLQAKDLQKVSDDHVLINIDGNRVLLNYRKSDFLGMIFVTCIPQDQVFGSLIRYRIWFWIISLFSLIVLAIFSFWVYGLIAKPINNFMWAFRKLENGDLSVVMSRKSNDEFKYLYDQFNKTAATLDTLIKEAYEQKIQVQRAELKQLQYQINPHFLYNSIHIIYRMAKKQDYNNIIKLSKHLGDYYQTITRSNTENISLEMERKHIIDYISIQNIRFEGRIRADVCDLPHSLINFTVPKLILQPIVENAYGHGLKNKLEKGVLEVRFQEDEQYVNVIIEDNGDETGDRQIDDLRDRLASNDKRVENTGLLNIHKRIQIAFGYKSGLEIARSELGGLKVIVKIERK